MQWAGDHGTAIVQSAQGSKVACRKGPSTGMHEALSVLKSIAWKHAMASSISAETVVNGKPQGRLGHACWMVCKATSAID